MTLARDLTSAARVINAGRKYHLEADQAIRFALDILALGDASHGETINETGDRELIRRASSPATRIDGAAGESPEQGPDAGAVAADADMTAPRNPGKSVRDGEGGDALPEPDDGRTTTEKVIDLLNAGVTDKRVIAQRIGATRSIVGMTITKARIRRDPRLKEFAPAPAPEPDPAPIEAPAPVEREAEPEAAGDSDTAEAPALSGHRLVVIEKGFMSGPGGFFRIDKVMTDPRWLRLVEALAPGGMMFLSDLAMRTGVRAEDVRTLLNAPSSVAKLLMIGLALVWQGKDMLRLEIIPQAKD